MVTRRNFLKLSATGSALATLGHIPCMQACGLSGSEDTGRIDICNGKIPIFAETDILILGGSGGAVAAASAARNMGSKVFLATSLPYLGDDICGTFRFDRDKEKADHPLSKRLFGMHPHPVPHYIKTELENELLDNEVDFLYSTFVIGLLEDKKGHLSGAILTGRSGKHIIRCKAIIDATHAALGARVAKADMTNFIPGVRQFDFVTVGNKPENLNENTRAVETSYKIQVKNTNQPVIRYTFNLPVKDSSYPTLQNIEQQIRDKTWTPDQTDSADLLEYIPFQSIISSGRHEKTVSSAYSIPLEAAKPKNIKNLWVISPSADVSPEIARFLLHPVNNILWGSIAGEKIAEFIADKPLPPVGKLIQTAESPLPKEDIRELIFYGRTGNTKRADSVEKTSLPILGEYDVVVLGGGTAGAPAGISAARNGAKTLLIENLHGLGGLMTLGLIGRYWDGFRGGYTEEVDLGVKNMAPENHLRQFKDWKNNQHSDWKQEYFRKEFRKAGGELWFGVTGSGAVVAGKQITGIVVVTPFGSGIVKGKVIIDSTGSADIAIAAGAAYEYTGKNVAVQGAAAGFWSPGDYYNNNDWSFIDDTDMLDLSRVFVQAKRKLAGKYDMVKIAQTRERRRVVGDYTVSVYDVINHKRYPDTISYHKSSFDTHGMIVDPYFMLSPPEKRHTIYEADVPLRSLLPQGLEGIIVTGLGTSADRDAMPVIRMQSCLQSQGYAVGYLASVAAKENKSLRKVDIKKIQRYLVGMGNLPSRILSDNKFREFTNADLKLACNTLADEYKGLSILLTNPEESCRLIMSRFNSGKITEQDINYATFLCMMGNPAYASVVAERIEQFKEWDTGWNYTGMGQFGPSMSLLDSLITALGKSKNKTYLPVILKKAAVLKPENTFSHFRAISMATESIADPAAIPILHELLTMPGMRHHHLSCYRDARRKTVPGVEDVSTRNSALKEIHLARALYACGDKEKTGEKILKNYSRGLEAHYARYADYVLLNKGSI